MAEASSMTDVALIGAGGWGKNLARNFRELGVLRVLCDISEQTVEAYRQDESYEAVEKTTDVERVFQDEHLSRVVIAAPAAEHFDLARRALDARKDVFVEKPLCLRTEDAEVLVAMAESSGQVLMVGHLLQYHPCVEELQSLVARGELGRLYYVTSNRLNLGKIRREENALWSFAPHDLSVILSLAGNQMPEETRCTGGSYLSEGVADTTLTSLRFPGGIRGHVYVSWLNPFKEQKLTVVGSHGMLVFDDGQEWEDKLVLYRQNITWAGGHVPTPNKNPGERIVVAHQEPLRQECEHFLRCCDQRSRPRTDGSEGLRVLRVLEAAQLSLEGDGKAVHLTAPPEASERMKVPFYVHPSSVVDERVAIGKGTRIWHFCHVSSDAVIGDSCVLGQNTMVGDGVVIGHRVKIQNNVSVYSGVTVEDEVFLGPSCVLTNVSNPRSQINRHSLYERTLIKRGASIGANATILPGVTLGRYCFISAGAVVTRDVPDYALMRGVPARRVGWFSRHGHLLEPDDAGLCVCPESGFRYQVLNGQLRCLSLAEDQPLPTELAVGNRTFQDWKEVAIRAPGAHDTSSV